MIHLVCHHFCPVASAYFFERPNVPIVSCQSFSIFSHIDLHLSPSLMAIDQAQAVELSINTRELVPTLVDRLAEVKPNSLYAEYPVSTLTYEEGYRRITYRDLANAVNGVAWWLQEALGPGKDFEILAYIGPNDLRYPALILGAVKAGSRYANVSLTRRSQNTHRCRCFSHRLVTASPPKSTSSVS